ncbi:MAG TPA: zf-HC2 domain-containing protein [Candidatus Sulfotelmatobacter sp.]|nr:zf-HC2 domain-containing protein [Candidatus Sulfotelmatobacter sp.]
MSHTEPHDEFLELCAVSTSGQLTEEEQKKLEEHLAVCSSCREAIKQYEAVVAHAIPAMAADEVPENLEPGPAWSQHKAEAALFARIAQEDKARTVVRGNGKADTPQGVRRVLPFAGESTWRHVWSLYAAGVLLAIALGVSLYQIGIRHGVDTTKVVPAPAQPNSQNSTPLEAQVSDAAHEREVALAQVSQKDRQIADLRKQLERQSVELTEMKAAQDRLAADLNSKDAGAQNLVQQQAELKQKFDAAQSNAQALQQKLDTLSKQSAEDQARAGQLTAQVKDLTQALRDRDATLDQKDELLAKDRDIRELMGARDLYVAEVYDVARTGETQKPYGRVFYTRGKSLIFYAYDLDQEPGLKAARAFQAWGQHGPDRTQALNLGIFYVDNSSKKRWVLKFDDPKMLAQIDAVFVTIEPSGGSRKPSGKPLLFAYLKADPNHP